MDLRELEQIIMKLSAISSPVGLIPTIGIPLFNATEELKEFYNRAVAEANKAKAEEEGADKPELKLVKEEPEDGGDAEHVSADGQ